MVDGGVGGGEWWLVVAGNGSNHQKIVAIGPKNRAGRP